MVLNFFLLFVFAFHIGATTHVGVASFVLLFTLVLFPLCWCSHSYFGVAILMLLVLALVLPFSHWCFHYCVGDCASVAFFPLVLPFSHSHYCFPCVLLFLFTCSCHGFSHIRVVALFVMVFGFSHVGMTNGVCHFSCMVFKFFLH